MGRGNVQNIALQRGELGHRTKDSSSALLADLQRATNDIKVRLEGGGGGHKTARLQSYNQVFKAT